MTRFWFEFDVTGIEHIPPGLKLGCGVTAINYDDAISIVKEKIFKDGPLPSVKKMMENVSLADLDENHVLPNIGVVTGRGIWFPLGY